MLEIVTRRIAPTFVSSGPRFRAPNRTKIGALVMSRIVIFVIAMSSSNAPSTASSARPRQKSNVQLLIVIFLNPPFDSVPILIRPVGDWCEYFLYSRLYVPSKNDPSSYPLTEQFVIVM